MTRGDWFGVALVAEYAFLAVVYAGEGNWPKVGYWIGAAILGTSVVLMR
ncbi:MAG: hypothetical protein AABY90_09535 [Nitrospirota bacterium]